HPETWRRLDTRSFPALHQAMTTFQDFYRPSPQAFQDGSLGDEQQALDERFPAAVGASPFQLWSPGDPIPQKGNWLLIGVATWSAYDMKLLDVVSEALRERGPALPVAVFNVASCLSH